MILQLGDIFALDTIVGLVMKGEDEHNDSESA